MCQLTLYFAALVEMKQLMACQGHEDYTRCVLLCPAVRQPFGFVVRYNAPLISILSLCSDVNFRFMSLSDSCDIISRVRFPTSSLYRSNWGTDML